MAIPSNRSPTFGVPSFHSRSDSAILTSCFLLHKLAVFISSCNSNLACFSDEDIERMIANGRQTRCLWVYAPESDPCSAMQGIMWELQRKVRQFHQSAETFWLHNGSVVNRDLVEFSNWKLPMPLP